MIGLYLDCASGASGDMLLGALVDLGVPPDVVQRSVDALGIEGAVVEFEETRVGELRAMRARVRVTDDATARSYRDIRELLGEAPLDDTVRGRALSTFAALARAEAHVHGIDLDSVHFHEVGGLDALIDVVGVCAALSDIAASRIVVSPIATGRGTVQTQHGTLPVPAPAVLELLRGAVIEERGTEELVTPTGAALLAANAHVFGAMPSLRVVRTGYGAGTRELPWPNVLRVTLGELVEVDGEGDAVVECNVDDMAPELLPNVVRAALDAGAADAWVTPILMKKGRPGHKISVLLGDAKEEDILDLLFRETTTFGARSYRVAKHELQRRWIEVEVHGHPVRVKLATREGEVLTTAVEHEDAAAAALATGAPLKRIYELALNAALGDDRSGSG